MTCRRANPKGFTNVRYGQKGEIQTDRISGEETSTFQRKLTIPTLEDIDRPRIIGENNECPQPCADELTEDVAGSLEPRKPSEDSHTERYLEIRAHSSESLQPGLVDVRVQLD
jgi:hypothetical protein